MKTKGVPLESCRGLGGRERSRVLSVHLLANLRKNVNVEPSGDRNAQWGPCLRTLFRRRAFRVAIATKGNVSKEGEGHRT